MGTVYFAAIRRGHGVLFDEQFDGVWLALQEVAPIAREEFTQGLIDERADAAVGVPHDYRARFIANAVKRDRPVQPHSRDHVRRIVVTIIVVDE